MEKIAVPVIAGIYGIVTEVAISGQPKTTGDVIEASIWNALWDNIPTKYLGPLGRRKQLHVSSKTHVWQNFEIVEKSIFTIHR